MEENTNITPEMPVNETPENNNVPEVMQEQSTEVSQPSPVQEKLESEMEKQNIDAPPIVTETAEEAVNAASVAAGETKPDPKKVGVKKPTKRDPIVTYNNNVVLWFIPIN